MIEFLHQNLIIDRRVSRLVDLLTSLITQDSRVLDIGAGDGRIAHSLLRLRSDISITAVDTLVRNDTLHTVTKYDGVSLPFEDNSFDFSLFVDVLHHCDEMELILMEAKRVSSQSIIIKDHLCETSIDHKLLTFMDNIGNARFGVDIPMNYLSRHQWELLFTRLGMDVDTWDEDLKLYPFPLEQIFGGGLHVLTRLNSGSV